MALEYLTGKPGPAGMQNSLRINTEDRHDDFGGDAFNFMAQQCQHALQRLLLEQCANDFVLQHFMQLRLVMSVSTITTCSSWS
jgi:hypothetical protein